MIETVLIQRMLAVVPFEAYRRCLAQTISDLHCGGNVAGWQIPGACLRSSSPFFRHERVVMPKLVIPSALAVAASAFWRC